MSVEGLCVFLSLFRFLVARSKECLEVFHIQVAESLFYNRVDEWAVVFFVSACQYFTRAGFNPEKTVLTMEK